MTSVRFGVALLAVWAVAAGCQAQGASPSHQPLPSATPDIGTASIDELNAMRFRESVGFRADLEYIRRVAADPTAVLDFGTPLLPVEAEELYARATNADAVVGVVQAEANAHPDDFCGVYLDHDNGGAVTSRWRANLPLHEIAIRLELNPNARVAFESCRFSLAQLRALQDRVTADREWFETIPAHLLGVGADEKENVLRMEVSTAVPDVAERIAARFDVPLEALRVTSDGTGAAFVPWGEVDVTIVGPDGKTIDPRTDEDDAFRLIPGWKTPVVGLRCGHGDMGVGFQNLPCQAGVWTITVDAEVGDGDWVTIGEGSVTVIADETSKLTIEIGPIPTYRPD